MPNKKRKGMVLISFVTIIFLFLNGLYFTTFTKTDALECVQSPFSSKNNSVEKPYCGDLFCDYLGGETPLNCPEDCYFL
jgi:hypothetical protein